MNAACGPRSMISSLTPPPSPYSNYPELKTRTTRHGTQAATPVSMLCSVCARSHLLAGHAQAPASSLPQSREVGAALPAPVAATLAPVRFPEPAATPGIGAAPDAWAAGRGCGPGYSLRSGSTEPAPRAAWPGPSGSSLTSLGLSPSQA